MQAAVSDAPRPATFRLGYRRWLDGLRGVAILLVLAYHCNLGLSAGFLGVDLFFVLSGFLITSLLLEEFAATGGISLRRFYFRRALRLLPALLVMLTAMGVWVALTRPRELTWFQREATIVLCFGTNMQERLHHVPMAKLLFTWSLSVEEQFYLVWSATILVLLRCRVPKPALLGVIVAGVAVAAALRADRFAALPAPTDPRWAEGVNNLYRATEARVDAPLCGCLAAVLASWGVRARPALRRKLHVVALLSVLFMTVCVFVLNIHHERCYYGLFAAFALAAAALIYSMVVAPLPVLRRVLEWIPLVGVGRISYGLFLFHIPVAMMLGNGTLRMGWAWPGHTALVLGVSILAAAVSYYGIERPVLRLKDRFALSGVPHVPPAPTKPAVAQQPPRMAA